MSRTRKRSDSPGDRPTIGLFTQHFGAAYLEMQWRGIADAAAEQGVNLICLAGGVYDPLTAPNSANILYDLTDAAQLDGLIVWGGNMLWRSNPQEVGDFLRRYEGTPTVCCEMMAEGAVNILLDDYQGMRQAVEHLIREHGRRKIVFVRGPEDHLGAGERYRGYCDALTENGLPLDPALVTPPSPWLSTPEEMRPLLDSLQLRPGVDYDGLAGVSANMALAAASLLQQRGIHVPDQVAVVGFDDIPLNVVSSPALTTVQTPFYEMGRLALETVVAVLRGQKVSPVVVQPTRLLVRRSCGCFDPLVAQAALTRSPSSAHSVTDATLPQAAALDLAGLQARREAIAAEMARSVAAHSSLEMHAAASATSHALQLTDALLADLAGEVAGKFLHTLDAIAGQAVTSGGEINAWHAALSALRSLVTPYLDQPASTLLDSWISQARVILSQAAERAQINHALMQENLAIAQRQLTACLSTAADLTNMMDGLAEILPRLGIPSCFVSLYENPALPAEGARLVMAYRDGNRLPVEAQQVYPLGQWLPPALLPSTERFTFIVHPLLFEGQQLGFVVAEMGPRQGAIYENLSQELSASLYKLQTAQQEMEQRRQMEQTLAYEQHLFRVLLDNLPEQIYFKDLQSQFIRINQTQAKRLGMADPSQAVGKTDFDFFDETHARPAFEDEQRIIQTGQPIINLEEKEVYPDGRVAWVSTTKMPLRDESGRITGTFGVSRDITARKQAEEALASERNLLRTLIDNMPLMIYVKDRQGRYLTVNQAHADFLGVTPEAIIGKTDADFFSTDLAERYRKDDEAIMASGTPLVDREEPIINQENGEIEAWNQITKVPLHDANGYVIGLVGIGHDITDAKRAQMEREHLLNDLERRAIQLQTAADVSRAASSILDPVELIQKAVDLIRDRFRLYYVGLFLVDQTGEWTGDPNHWAVLRAGTGEAGLQMLSLGHKLEIGETSMIGWCVLHKQARIALDVGKDAVRFRNPYLPETRSELAMPLVSRGEVIGALTIQSERSAAFSEEDITIFQTMADQIANAIANARLYERTQAALQEIEATYRRYILQGWSSFVRSRAVSGYKRTPEGVSPLGNQHLPEVQQAIAEQKIVQVGDPSQPEVVIPIKLREQPIGAMGFKVADGSRQWTSDEIALIESLSEQFALAAENLRLLDETQRRAERERLVADITTKLRASNDPQAILQTAASELRQALAAKDARVMVRERPSQPSPAEKT